jgi:hypothetical protein
VNQPRYNLMLIVPFAIAGGMALERARQRWWVRSDAGLMSRAAG